MRQYYISVLADESGRILESKSAIRRKIKRAKNRRIKSPPMLHGSAKPKQERPPAPIIAPQPKQSVGEKLEDVGAATAAGAATGAAVGSVFPVVGTAIGSAAGAAIGAVGSVFSKFF